MRRGHPLVVIPFAGLLLALLLLVLPPAYARAWGTSPVWYVESQIATNSNINVVRFQDSLHGFAVGTNGGLFFTQDGGQTWTIKSTGVTNDLYDIRFADAQHGFISGDSILLRTSDGGATWQQAPTAPPGDISAATPITLYAVGNGQLYGSPDAGNTWQPLPTPQSTYPDGVVFVSALEGWLFAGNDLYHTVDGANTWTLALHGDGNLQGFSNPIAGMIVLATPGSYDTFGDFTPGTIYKTMDDGSTWSTIPNASRVEDPIFSSTTQGIGFVNNYCQDVQGNYLYDVYATNDGGVTWQNEPLPTDAACENGGPGANIVGYRDASDPYVVAGNYFLAYGILPTPSPTPQPDTPTPTDTSVPTAVPPTSIPPTSVPTQIPPTSVPSNTPRPTPTSPPAPSPTRRPAATPTHNPGDVGGDTPTPDTSGNTGGDTPTPPLDQGAPTDTPVPPLTSAHGGNRPALHCRASNLQEVVACVEASILRVVVHLPDGDAQGTAFVVRSDGSGTYLLTNRHVIDGGTPATVRVFGPDGHTRYSVKQIVVNTARPGTAGDLAILRLGPTKLRPLAFGNSAALKAGQSVASIGYGLAFQLAGPPSVTEGIVSAVGRDLNDGFGPVWIQHQSTINHGNSGGPLLDLHGNVVGINTLSIDQLPGASGDEPVQGVFFAIPTNLAKPIVATLIARAQQPTSQLRATAPSPVHVTLADLSFTVSRGWLVSHVQRQQPTFSSRDQLVQMHVLTQSLGHKPDLAALIRRLTRAYGPLKTLGTHHITLAGLHGVQGSATFTHIAGRVTVTALQDPAQRRIVVIETVLHAGATTGDQKQASATLDSLRVSAPARHKSHK